MTPAAEVHFQGPANDCVIIISSFPRTEIKFYPVFPCHYNTAANKRAMQTWLGNECDLSVYSVISQVSEHRYNKC